MKKIKYLKKGSKIYLVAPSFGCNTSPYDKRLKVAIKNLNKEGYKIIKGENIFLAKSNTRSNTPKLCAKEFNDAYLNSDADLILSVGGGETMCEILPYINFKKISEAQPKLFMGFSDNTNLTYTLTTICDVYSIYGPCAPSFCFKPYKYNLKDTLDLLKGKKDFKGYKVYTLGVDHETSLENPLLEGEYDKKNKIKLFSKNKKFDVHGRLLGGCIDILTILCGTKFDKTKEYIEKYKNDGFIWYLECCDLNPISFERALFQLKEAGWFKYAKGFIIGRPLHLGEIAFNQSFYDSTLNMLKDLNLPIMIDVDLGHIAPSIPIINGALASIKYKERNIFITYDKNI